MKYEIASRSSVRFLSLTLEQGIEKKKLKNRVEKHIHSRRTMFCDIDQSGERKRIENRKLGVKIDESQGVQGKLGFNYT